MAYHIKLGSVDADQSLAAENFTIPALDHLGDILPGLDLAAHALREAADLRTGILLVGPKAAGKTTAILQLARHHQALITIEEGAIGGFGSQVAQLLADEGVFDHGLKFRSMVLPDSFIDQSSPENMYAVAGMNAPQIEAKVLEVMGVASVGLRA